MGKKNLRHFDRERLIWDAKIEPNHKLILLAYNSFLGSNDSCWPSNTLIEAMVGIPRRTLLRELKRMKETSLIVVLPRFLENKSARSSNETKINWQNLEILASATQTLPPSATQTLPPSATQTLPPSATQTPPSATQTPPSATQTPDLIHRSNPRTDPSLDLIHKNPPISPQWGERDVANASKSEETIATELEESETKSNAETKSNPGEEGYSAPRRRSPSKATQKIQRAYADELPPWRYGHGLNEYHDWFVRYAKQKHQELPEGSYFKKNFSPIGLIAARESKAEFEELQQRCDEAWAIEVERNVGPMQTRQPDFICSQPSSTELPTYDDLSNEIAIIQNILNLRSWGWVHPQVQLWVCTAQELAKHYAWPPIKFEPALGLSNWPDWAIAKFAKDLEATCIKP